MFNDFSTNDFGGFLNNTQSGETPAKEKGARRLQNVTPVCIRQIRDNAGEEFSLFGMTSQILTMVAILRDVEVTSTKATYQIEDHTAAITAVLWLDNESSSINLPSVKEGHYCRVYGSLRKNSDGQKIILILKMMPVDDINEVTTHLLEVIHNRFAAEKMSKENTSANIAQNNPSADLVNSMSTMYDNQSSTSDNHFTPIQQKIYNILKQDKGLNGFSIDHIKSQFNSSEHRELNAAMEYLSEEGHIYTTIDDRHFKATD